MSPSSNDIATGVVGVILTGVASVVTWLVNIVMRNKDSALLGGAKIDALDSRVEDLERHMLTTEDVRRVIEGVLDKRDAALRDRREEWDKRLALEIRAAVGEAISTCPYMGRGKE